MNGDQPVSVGRTSSIRVSLIANIVGQGMTAVLNIAVVPLYIIFLGIDGYALAGIFVVIIVVVSMMEGGFIATLNREMSLYAAGKVSAEDARDLLVSVEYCFLALALIIGLLAIPVGDMLAAGWIKSGEFPASVIAFTLTLMILAAVARIGEALYRSVLLGLHRPILANSLGVAGAAARTFGAIGAMAIWGASVEVFFLWQLAVATALLTAHAIAVRYSIGTRGRKPRFSLARLNSVRLLAAGAFAATALSIVLTQVDKIVLVKMIPLSAFGLYSVAAVAVAGLQQIAMPIYQSFVPRFAEHVGADNPTALNGDFRLGTQLLSILTVVPAAILIAHSEAVVFVWTGNAALSIQVAPILSLLMIGALANALGLMPFALQIAHANTSPYVRSALGGAIILVPAIAIAAQAGVQAAAGTWAAVMVFVFIANVVGTHGGLARSNAFGGDVLKPLAVAGLIAGISLLLWPDGKLDRFSTLAMLVGTSAMTLAAAWIVCDRVPTIRALATSHLTRPR